MDKGHILLRLALHGLAGFCILALLAGCNKPKRPQVEPGTANTNKPQAQVESLNSGLNGPDPCSLILLPVPGESRLDRNIARCQQAVREGTDINLSVERLGWLFVSKARASFDPGFYKLAEQCALCLEDKKPHNPEALLLRGHVLLSLHRFKEAEPLARELVTRRGLSHDYALLGDVLMELGLLDEAIVAYQKMADLRPDLESYARAAHVRWLKGDLTGAIEAMQTAIQSSSPLDPETAAWVYSRMASYQLQAGDLRQGLKYSDAALQFQTNYPPALLARGRLLLAEGQATEAIEPLRQAEALNPLPEYQWTLLEALRANGESDPALEKKLNDHGAANDPRTYALYLASQNQNPALAVQLAQNELQTRSDTFTHDALAWALASAGKFDQAGYEMEQALSQGTQDARLFYHAGIIQENLGQYRDALQSFIEADGFQQTLLPSERSQVTDHLLALGLSGTDWAPQFPDADPDRAIVASGKGASPGQ